MNANGSLKDDVDLAKRYLPGYEGTMQKVSTGNKFSTQVYTGQKMKLILDGVGKDTPGIAKVDFVLTSTISSHAGYASNGKSAAVTGANKEKDYSFKLATDQDNQVVEPGSMPNEVEFTGGKMEPIDPATKKQNTWVYFWAKDYGGATKVEARVYKVGSDTPKVYTLAVPKDDDADGLADIWEREMVIRWKVQYFSALPDNDSLTMYSPSEDFEYPDPNSTSNPRQIAQSDSGDAHTVLEEYRGYILDGGGFDGAGANGHPGGHKRLDPARKEYLVEADVASVPEASLPQGGISEALNQAAKVFSSTALHTDQIAERGAGIYMYWLIDDSAFFYNANDVDTDAELRLRLKNQRDTSKSRAAGIKNLRTDFVHLLLLDDIHGVANLDPNDQRPHALAYAETPELRERGAYMALTNLKADFDQGAVAGVVDAAKWSDFVACSIAHELTHLLFIDRTPPNFDIRSHTVDSNVNGTTNPTVAANNDAEDPFDLMYQYSQKKNKEVSLVRFFNLVKARLKVAGSYGLDP